MLTRVSILTAAAWLAAAAPASAQDSEPAAGFDLRATLSGFVSSSNGNSADVAYRAVLYPTWKLNENWSVTGVYQLNSAYSYPGTAPPSDYLAKGFLLQGSVNYSVVRGNKALTVRAGQLSTAFGSFMTRYDDAVNWFAAPPASYGYYAAVSTLGVPGAQIDASVGKWDARVQFANSSPANPRGLLAADQYGNWAAGGGYTIRPGFRIGVSGYYGPYLDRKSPFFVPGEAPPIHLKARASGIDAQWGAGHWNIQGEWQRFVFPYDAIPTFREQAGYVEVKRVLHPRWYAAVRAGYTRATFGGSAARIETAVGYRPSAFTLIKLDYQRAPEQSQSVLALQFVSTLRLR